MTKKKCQRRGSRPIILRDRLGADKVGAATIIALGSLNFLLAKGTERGGSQWAGGVGGWMER